MSDEIAVAAKDAPQATGQPSVAKAETTPQTPKTYTEEQVAKRISDALADAGRKHKADLEPILKERDALKTEVTQAKKDAESATFTLNETKENISALEQDLETLSETNPDSAEIIKLKKEIRSEKLKLNQEVKAEKDAVAELKRTLEKEREDFAGEVSEARAMKFEVDVFEVAEDFEGGDSARLKALCEKAGKMKRSEIEDLAAVLWTKKEAKTDNEPNLVTDSGVTNGGSTRTKAMIQLDYGSSKITRAQYEKEMAANHYRID